VLPACLAHGRIVLLSYFIVTTFVNASFLGHFANLLHALWCNLFIKCHEQLAVAVREHKVESDGGSGCGCDSGLHSHCSSLFVSA
jgi:hypothetical protein